MILRQLVLRQMQGTRTAVDLPASPIAVYSEAEIETLLAPEANLAVDPEGIRFHFDRPSGTNTVGLVAVSLGLIPNPNIAAAVGTSEISSETKKYVQRGQTKREISKEVFLSDFQSLANKGVAGNNSVCVFYGRNDLRELLDQPGITRIAFFPAQIQRNFTGLTESYDTLLAVGQTATGVTQGLQIISELPCPPHCSDDYP